MSGDIHKSKKENSLVKTIANMVKIIKTVNKDSEKYESSKT
jgi:hypothetical protein